MTPLDWGLGHATRCIPVIRELRRQGCEVMIAGSGDSLALLRKEFPSLKHFFLPAYQPRYPGHGSMVWAMAFQIPKFMRVISAEHRVVENIMKSEKIDLVISDNRYGCWSRNKLSVFITHQSNILMPKRFGWLQHMIRRLNDSMINRFNYCWIPDFPDNHSLAGNLIQFGKSGVKVKKEYIGWLSRFEFAENKSKQYDVVAIFSGPEPQRTLVEKIVVAQLKTSGLAYRVVRGLPMISTNDGDFHTVNFLSSDELKACIEAADMIIARSGYSTVMDMSALGKKVVFIPTPGQTEQEYLAKRLMEKGISYFMNQSEFHLQTAMEQTKKFPGFPSAAKNHLLREVVAKLLRQSVTL